uniref:42 kDa transposase n=1 Tax=Tetrahymena thermophila TaxID=5911 RepID=M5DDM4_TETTH|nr:42 kDa transposase [Tetrahymena thermophila]
MLSGNLTGFTAPEILEKLKGRFRRQAPLTKTKSFYYTLRRKLNWGYSMPIAQKEKMNDPETIGKRLEYSCRAVPLIHQGRNFVYIDETAFQVRDRARKTWQPRGRKLIVSEQNKTKSYTLIGALDSTGFLGYIIAEKGAQQEQFMGFISELIKYLDQKGELRNCVFIMDNATIHSSALIEKTILKHIPHLFLAPYSPQMNPIEKLWFIIKSRLSKKRIRDLNSLLRAIFITAQSIDAQT